MSTRLKHTPSQELVEPKVGLQIRALYRDRNGEISDVTHDDQGDGRGLKDLQERSANAYSGLVRTKELLDLLALAAEGRKRMTAALVRRVLQEIETELSHGGDLGSFVRYTRELLEHAMPLPRISGIVASPAFGKRAS